jgi:hypothetical protein
VAVLLMLATSVVADVGAAQPAHACSCVAFTDDQAFGRADVVFEGRVVRHSAPVVGSSNGPALWTFAVDRVYKGTAGSRQGVVSARMSPSCGLDPPRDTALIVFARRRPQPFEPRVAGTTLYANLCSGTRPLGDRAVPASFGRSRAPLPGERGVVDIGVTDGDLRRVRVAVVGLVALVGGAIGVRARRTRTARRRRAGERLEE